VEFTKKSTKELNKLLMTVVKELEQIRKLNKGIGFTEYIELPDEDMRFACRNIKVNISNEGWYLQLDKDSYKLSNGKKSPYFTIATRKNLGFCLAYDEEDKEALLVFLKHYPTARERLIKRVEEEERKRINTAECKALEQEKTMNELKKLKKIYQKEATIEIQVPPTNNQHTLEVSEEDGKKVGTLSISGMTLKIIASDSIKIVNKTSNKTKRKDKLWN